MIVVARHDHQPSCAEGRPELLEERPRAVERRGQRAVAELDRVSQQHDLVRALDLGPQRLAQVAAAKQVDAPARPEVEVGEDDRSHARNPRAWRGGRAMD